MDERATKMATPTKSSAVFASATNRFEGIGAVYTERDLSAPAVGTYSTEAAVAQPSAGTTAGFRAPSTAAGERFAGVTSIYGSTTPGKATPGVGEYTPNKRAGGGGDGAAAGTTAGFKDETDRFARHDGIYAHAVSAAAAANPIPPSASPAQLGVVFGLPSVPSASSDLPARDQTTAAFKDTGSRFETIGSVYHASASAATPGVGTYTMDAKSTDLSFAKSSTFESSTDRFTLPLGVYTDTPGADSPAVSAYEAATAHAATQAARVRGAVKLQAAIRRRQSRGIFSDIEAEAAQKPGPVEYDPELLPRLAKTKLPAPKAAATSSLSEMELAQAANLALLASTLETLDEATAALASLSVSAPAPATSNDAKEEVKEAQVAPAPEEQASPPASPLRSGSMLGELSSCSPMQMPSAMKVPAEASYLPSPAAYERLSSAPLLPALPRLSVDADELAESPVVREPPKGRLSRVVSLDMWLAEMSDDDTSSELPSVREEGEADAATGAAAAPEEGAEDQDGDWLFSQLERIAEEGVVAKEDYYSPEDGWDLEGLRSDLALYAAVEVL